MDELLLRSHELRDDPAVHYNCAQGVFIPFAEKKGLTKQQAFDIAQNFGGGMRAGMTCGAITGGLMHLDFTVSGSRRMPLPLFRRSAACTAEGRSVGICLQRR